MWSHIFIAVCLVSNIIAAQSLKHHESFSKLIHDAYYEDALSVAQMQLKRSRKSNGERHASTLQWMNSLAQAKMLLAHHKEAQDLVELVILQTSGEKRDHNYAKIRLEAYSIKAQVYLKQGNYSACSEAINSAEQLSKKHKIFNQSEVAKIYFVRGLLESESGRFSAAGKSFQKSLTIFQGLQLPLWQARVLQHSGESLISSGKIKQGRDFIDQSIMLRSEMQLTRHPDWADALDNMAALLILAGNLGAPLSLVDKAQTIRYDIFKKEHPERIKSIRMRALLMEALGDLRSALRERTTIYDKLSGELGTTNAKLFSTVVSLARVHTRLNNPNKAQFYFDLANKIYIKNFSNSKVHEYRLMLTEALLVSASAKYFQADKLYQKILKDPTYAGRAEVLLRAAEVKILQGNNEEAELMLSERLKLLEQDLGIAHPTVGQALKKLAALHYEKGKPELSVKLIKKSLDQIIVKVGEDHPEVLNRLAEIIFYQQIAKKLPEAAKSFEMALRIQKRNFGETHSEVLVTMNNLAGVYGLLGRKQEAEKLLREIRLIEAGGNPTDNDILFGNSPELKN